MDEDEDSLQDLVAQAQSRPRYVRILSWEFKNERKESRRKKKLQGLEKREEGQEEEQEESSSSEEEESDSQSSYYSAEEDVTEILEEEVEQVNLQEEPKNVSSPYRTPSHYRAPSKKQKRKRRSRTMYCTGSQALPFMTTGLGIEEDIQEFVTEIKGKQFCVLREVPSLTMLCMKLLRGVRYPANSVPYLIKSHMFDSNADLKFKRFQYGWLLNLLVFVDKEEDLHSFRYLEEMKSSYRLPLCSVWYPFPYIKEHNGSQISEVYQKSKISACLMYTSGQDVEHDEGRILLSLETYLRVPLILSVLGNVVEFMLPSQISMGKNKKHKSQSEEEHLRRATTVAVQRAKTVLSKRLPSLVDKFFNVSLPYAFWARGDISQATELFCQLSQLEKRYRYKAAYLNEAGRMHAMSQEMVSAAKFFRLATDAALSKHKHSRHAPEIEGQALMLLASLNDQGLLASKGASSWSGWRAVFTSDRLDSQGAAVHAVERWLCFHAGSWQGDCLAESISRLVSMIAQHPQLLYHLSLVHALRGDTQMSHKCYCDFREKVFGSNLPGEEMVQRRSENPWLPLVQAVKQQGQITYIPVLWRTQLRPLCLQTNPRRTQEADVISEQLNLRLTQQGLLTADMQLFLPPSGGVYLDPYTGKLVYFDNQTEPWRAVKKDSSGLVLPTPLQVYSDEEGVKVELLIASQETLMVHKHHFTNLTVDVSPIQDVCYLVWCGLDGKKVKVNLVPKFTDLNYEYTKEALKNMSFKCESMMQEALDVLETMYKRGYVMQAQVIKGFVLSNHGSMKGKKQTKPNKKRKKKIKERKQSFKLYSKPFVYGKTVALIFQAYPEFIPSRILVIVNCSSAGSFQKMQIYNIQDWSLTHRLTPPTNPVSVIRESQLRQGYRTENADVIHLHFLRPKERLEVFDQEGSIIDTIPINSFREGEVVSLQHSLYQGQVYPLIVKDQLIAITQHKRLWCRSKGEDFTHPDIEGVTSVAVFGDILIVLTEDTTLFLAVHQLRVLSIRVRDACERNLHLKIGESGYAIDQRFNTVQVFATQNISRNNAHFQICIAALDRTIVCLEVPTDMSKCSEVTLSLTYPMAGYPVEAYIISKSVGFLLTFTQHTTHSEGYVEHLCHYNFDGQLLGILPCLGPGPRSFYHAYLPGDPQGGGKGLYLYMRDGHNGIIGIQLEDHP